MIQRIRNSLLLLPFVLLPSFVLAQEPTLIVQIVVDQLRGDLIERHKHHFDKGGFLYLLNHGINYQNAHHPHANTTTCAGHTTIATGAYPSLHGIINNHWYDKKLRKIKVCMSDPLSPILPTNHTQKPLKGRSAHLINTSTLSDEIVLSERGRAFGVSLKDRSAIPLAGHAGSAFWFDKINGGFITSQYYYKEYPQWVKDWNDHFVKNTIRWNLSHNKDAYRYANAPKISFAMPDFNNQFPHVVEKSAPHYFKRLAMTPIADELTTDFAIQLLKAEKLGKTPKKTDYLGISFSVTDVIGHQFGPNSLESEDNIIRLDATLARLFKAIDETVGLEKTLIVLTADHGIKDSPKTLEAHNLRTSSGLDKPHLKTVIHDTLQKNFSLPKEAVLSIDSPYIYLDRDLIYAHHQNPDKVIAMLSENLSKEEGIYKVYPLFKAASMQDWISIKVNRMAFPNRAGDLYMVALPYGATKSKNTTRISHGSPWNYDSYVPLIFANPAFKPEIIVDKVHTTDIAPTLSAFLHIKAPSGAVGKPLTTVIDAWK